MKTRTFPTPSRIAFSVFPYMRVTGLFLVAVSILADVRTLAEVPFRHIVIDREFPRYPHCKTVGDLNGDALVDVLAASAFGQGLYWYRAPNWTKHRIDDGSFTTDMQTGDLDGDGDLDVVIPREGTGVVWYENQGARNTLQNENESWQRHVIDRQGGHDVEVGDVDGNGRLDVVVRNGQTRVFLRAGDGDWKKIEIPTEGRGGTALGDLDGDGDLDIAQNGYWLETPADKNAEWKRHEFASGWPDDVGVHIADVNKDGRLDLLIAPGETSGRLSWYESENPKAGSWKEHVIADDVSHIHTFKTADIDEDGEWDVVTAEMEQSPHRRVSVYFNLGKGLSWRQQVVGRSGSHNLRVADIGNDGDIDIVGANHGNYGGSTPVEYWENLTNDPAPALALDRWERHVIDSQKPWGSTFIHAKDLNGDGLKDLVTGGWWYPNPGSSNEAWERRALGDPLNDAVLVADFDRDGDWDVLGTKGKTPAAGAQFVWAQNDGGGKFAIHSNIENAQGDFLQGCVLAFTRYRRMEVALSWHRNDQGVQMLTVPNNPSVDNWSWRKISDVSQDEALSAGQISRDTSVDLLMGTKWLRNERDRWTLHTLNPVSANPDRNRLADMNGDGLLDAVVGFEAINQPGKLAWYEQPANPMEVWTEHVIGTPVGPMSLDVGDMDRDGDMDVVVGEHNYNQPETARLLIFENTGGPALNWKPHVVSTGDEHHDGAVLADVDNDGDLDVVSIGWRNPRVLYYENRALVEMENEE